ncbi:MAG TPA: NAD(P)H-dependent oxidoreductase [Anaerolineae bacterium]|jgi:multimeric flavodoxin WrbA
MNILCISGSNISVARKNSASTHACELIAELVRAEHPAARVEIALLIDYMLKPCRMCGKCFDKLRCAHDGDFNDLHARMSAADAIFLVCPHYAPLPSKVMIVLEKLQEMMYLRSCAQAGYQFTLYNKPLGIVAHGGQTNEALPYYKTALLDPLANAFAGVQMDVVGAGEQWPNGATFGLRSIAKPADSIFVSIEHDWDDVRTRITPLVHNVLARVG